jgi:hypothetical protein
MIQYGTNPLALISSTGYGNALCKLMMQGKVSLKLLYLLCWSLHLETTAETTIRILAMNLKEDLKEASKFKILKETTLSFNF